MHHAGAALLGSAAPRGVRAGGGGLAGGGSGARPPVSRRAGAAARRPAAGGGSAQPTAAAPATKPSHRPANIMHRIHMAGTVWGLRSACRHVGHQFNAAHVTAALVQLSRLHAQHQSRSGAGMGLQQPSAASSPGHTGGGSAFAPASPPTPLSPRLPTSTPTPPNDLESHEQLTSTTLHCILQHLERLGGPGALDPCGLASVVWALGRMHPYNQAPDLQDLALQVMASAQPRLPSFTVQQLSMLICGLARLGVRPISAWCLAFCRASALQLRAAVQMGWQGPGAGWASGREAWAAPGPQGPSGGRRGAPTSPPPGPPLDPSPAATASTTTATTTTTCPPSSSSSRDSGMGRSTQPPPAAPASVAVTGLSSMLWALAHLGCHPPSAWLHAMLALCTPHLQHAQPHDLAKMAWALGALNYRPPAAFTAALMAAAAGQDSPAQLAGQPVAPGPHSLTATNPSSPSSPSRSSSSSSSSSNPSRARWHATDRACMLWGLARLGVRPPARWMEGMCSALTAAGSGVQEASGAEAAMLVYALARLGPAPPGAAAPSQGLRGREQGQAQGEGQGQGSELGPLLHGEQGRLHGLPPQQPRLLGPLRPAHSSVPAQPRLQRPLPLPLMQLPSQYQARPPPQPPPTPGQHSMVQGRMGHGAAAQSSEPPAAEQPWRARDSQLARQLLAQCLLQVSGELASCSPRTLVTLLWSCTRLGVRPHASFLASAMELLRSKWEQDGRGSSGGGGGDGSAQGAASAATDMVSARDLCTLAWSLSSLKVQPSPAWLHSLMAAAHARLPGATPLQLANLASGLAMMQAKPKMPWLLALFHALSLNPHQLAAREMKQVAAAFAALPATAAQRAVVAQHCPGLLQHLLVSGEGVLPAAKRRLVREALAMVPALNESQAARRRGVHARAEGARSRRRQLQAVRAWRMRRPRKPPAGAEGAEGTPAAALVAPTPAGAR